MARKKIITPIQQKLEKIVFNDYIDLNGERQSDVVFDVVHTHGRASYTTDNRFQILDLSSKGKGFELELYKKKKSGGYAENIAHEYSLYSKGALFAVPDKFLRETLKEIFESEECETLLVHEHNDSESSSRLFYIAEPDFENIPKEYVYKNRFVKSYQRNHHEVEKELIDSSLSIIQKEIFLGLLRNAIRENGLRFFHISEIEAFTNRVLLAVFEPSGLDITTLESGLGISSGHSVLFNIAQDRYPLSSLLSSHTNGEIVISGALAKSLRNLSKSNVLFLNMNTTNGDVVSSALSENFNMLKQMRFPSFNEIVDGTYEQNSSLSSSVADGYKNTAQTFYDASLKRALSSYFHSGSPVDKQNKASILLSVIKNESDIKGDFCSDDISGANQYVLFADKDVSKNEAMVKKYIETGQIENLLPIPYFLNNGGILLHLGLVEKSSLGIGTSTLATPSNTKLLLSNRISEDDFFQKIRKLALPTTVLQKSLSKTFSVFADRFSSENTEVTLQSFQKLIFSKIEDSLKSAPRAKEVLSATDKITANTFKLLSGVSNINKTDKIFPDIVNLDSINRMSLSEIFNSPFHIAAWLKLGDFRQILIEQLQKNGLDVPRVEAFEFDLTDHSKNILPDDKKERISSTKSFSGILSFQILPTVFNIESEANKMKFLTSCAESVLLPIRESFSDSGYEEQLKSTSEFFINKYLEIVQKCKYILVKITSEVENGVVQKKEKFVGVDQDMNDLVVFNTPVFSFYAVLQDRGMINIEDRKKNVEISATNVNKIYNHINEFSVAISNKHAQLKSKIDRMFGTMIDKALMANEQKFLVSFSNPDLQQKMASVILSSNNGMFLSEEFIKSKAFKMETKIESIFNGSTSPDAIELKKSLLNFYNKSIAGNEYQMTSDQKETSIRKIFYGLFDESDRRVKEFYGSMLEIVEHKRNLMESDFKLILMNAYSKHLDRLNSNPLLTPADKNRAITEYLSKVFLLRPHQILEVKGFLSLYLSEGITTDLLFHEMRTGKTRVMISLAHLLSMVLEKPSFMFIQNKNYSDISGQMFQTLPYLVSDCGVMIGGGNDYKTKVAEFPVMVSNTIYPNLVATIKRTESLQNPFPNSLVAADILGESYTNTFVKIHNACADGLGTLEKSIEEYGDDFKLLAPVFDIAKNSNNKELQSVLSASYHYVVKLFLEGYLQNSDMEKVSKVLIKKLESFTKSYLKSISVSSVNHENPSKIILGGKELINTHIANSSAPEKLTIDSSQGVSSFPCLTNLDVHVKEVDDTVGVKVAKEKLLGSLVLPEETKGYLDSGFAVLPMNSLTKIESDVLRSLSKNLSKIIEHDTISYAMTLDEKESAMLSGSASSIAGVVSSVISSKIRNMDSGYFDFNSAYLSCIKVNGNPSKSALLNIDKIFHSEITSSLPTLLCDAGLFESEDDAKLIIVRLFEELQISKKMSEALSLFFMKEAMNVIYFKNGAKTNTITSSITSFYPRSAGDKINEVEVSFFLDGEAKDLLTVGKKAKDSVLFSHEVFSLESEAVFSSNPAYFKKIEVAPREIVVKQDSSGGMSLVLNSASPVGEEDVFIPKRESDTKNLSSSFIWEMSNKSIEDDSRHIATVIVDEGHKNTGGSMAVNTKTVFEYLNNGNYPKIFATGTPDLGKTMSLLGNTGEKTARTVDQYCSRFKMDSLYLISIMEMLKRNDEVRKTVESHVFDFLSISFNDKSYVEMRAPHYANQMINDLNALPDFSMYHKALKEASNNFEDDSYVLSGVFEVAKKRNMKFESPIKSAALDIFLATVLKTSNGFVKKAAGATNYLGMSTIPSGMIGTSISIRRPEGVKYNILDRLTLRMQGANGVGHVNATIGEAEMLLQMEYLFNRKMYYGVGGSAVYGFYKAVFDFATQAIRENSQDFIGISTPNFNAFSNRSNSSIQDSFSDIYESFVASGVMQEMDDKKKDIYNVVIDAMNYVVSNEMDKITNGVKKWEPSTFVKLRDDFTVDAIFETLEPIKDAYFKVCENGHKIMRSNGAFTPYEERFGNANPDVGHHLFFDKTEGIQMISPVSSFSLRRRIHIEHRVSPELPAVDFSLSLVSPDDISIVESLAYAQNTIDLATKHIDCGENLRFMTTRVALTEASLLYALVAASKRADKDTKFNIFFNITEKRTLAFFDKVKDECPGFLYSNNIGIFKTTGKTLNDDCAPALGRRESVCVVGNYISLAEGINMDFINLAIYVGALKDMSAAFQSFARQIGNRQNESRIYLGNDGQIASLKGTIKNSKNSTKYIDFERVVDTSHSSAHDRLVHLGELFSAVKIGPSYTAKINDETLRDFEAYEIFMGGVFRDLSPRINIDMQNEVEFYLDDALEAKIIESIESDEEYEDEPSTSTSATVEEEEPFASPKMV